MPLTNERQFDQYFTQLYGNTQSLLPTSQNTAPLPQKTLDKIANTAVKQTLQGRTTDFGMVMRSVRTEGIDNSFVERLSSYSTNLSQRVLRSFSLGQRVRGQLNQAPIGPDMALIMARKLGLKYFKAEVALGQTKGGIYDEAEEMVVRKECRAFMLGLHGKPIPEFEHERAWLYSKNAAQIIVEEREGSLNSMQLTNDPRLDTLAPLV